jgi:dienelactone hydrolase
LLYLPDVLGIYENSKLLADEFAANGYITLLIDYFGGHPIELNNFAGVNIVDWVAHGHDGASPHTPKELDPIVKDAISYMKNDLGVKHLGAIGYCFGAKYVLRHYASGVEAGYIAHPSWAEDHEVAGITGPLSIAAAETDTVFTVELRHKSEEILKGTGQPYEIRLYSHVEHGFAVKKDAKTKAERWAKEQSLRQAVTFFDEWLMQTE